MAGAGPIPFPSGEALAALINQAGATGRTLMDEIRHGKIIIPAWALGKKAAKGKPEPGPVEIPASLALAAAAVLGLYWYFHSEHNQTVDISELTAQEKLAFLAGGPIGLSLFRKAQEGAAGLPSFLAGLTPTVGSKATAGPASGPPLVSVKDSVPMYTAHLWEWDIVGASWFEYSYSQFQEEAAAKAYIVGPPEGIKKGDQWTITDGQGRKVEGGTFK